MINKKSEKKPFPDEYRGNNYPYKIKNCPNYEGYIPKNLNHEVCGYCGNIEYYH